MRVDITSHSNFEAAFEKCLDLYNGIDVVVNNAGVDGEINWESQLQINFLVKKIRRGPKLQGCTFANFVNSSGTEGKPRLKRGKMGGKKEKKSMLLLPGIEPGTRR